MVSCFPADFETVLPVLYRLRDKNLFVTVNSYWEGTPGLRTGANHTGMSELVPELKAARRTTKYIQFLNLLFVDHDCHSLCDPPIEPKDVIAALIDKGQAGEIPKVSIFVLSGRGVWALWLLRNTDEEFPLDGGVRALKRNLETYRQCQNYLNERLRPWGADPNAKDAARVMRLPGSLNPKSGEEVDYLAQYDHEGELYVYSLDELRRKFLLSDPNLTKEKPFTKAQPNKKNGQIAVARNQFSALSRLEKMRGGFREGCRSNAVLLWGRIMRLTHEYKPHEIADEMREVGARCVPHLPPAEVEQRIDEVINRPLQWNKNQTLMDWLNVTTPREAALFKPKAKPILWRKAEKESRRRHILELWEVVGIRSVSGIIKALSDRYSMESTRKTIQQDLKILGFWPLPPIPRPDASAGHCSSD